MNKNNIPKHWQIKKLGEVCHVIMGQSPPSTSYNTNGIGLPFFQGKAEFTELYPVVEKWCNSPNKIAEPNDILLSVRAPVGTTNIANIKCCIGRGLAAIRYDNYKYVFYFLKSIEQELDSKGTGTTFRAISGETIRMTEIPVPPPAEQKAIVTKIEELLSELENGIQQLETAQQQLKVYRQSLLKWAFEGKLTNKKVNDGELPKGWKIKELKEITSVLGDGLHGTPKYSANGDYYFINGNNLNDGKIEIKENTKRVSFEEYNKYKKPLNEKTIFVSINGSLGYTAFYNNENVILGKSACYFNVLETINKSYIRYFLTSSRFTSYANKNATGSTIKNVGLKTMRELQVPIPPRPAEQQLIVDELESKLTVCDKIEETISQSLQQAETLKQSILKQAFEGKLVNNIIEKVK
jgi:type I restriction enzyme S subunit